VQPNVNPTEGSEATIIEDSEAGVQETQQAVPSASTQAIIWTPSFMVTFALTVVLGLSAEGLLTQGWVSGLYAGGWVLLALAILVFGGWIITLVRAHSWWIRIGAIFGCIWALFACLNAGMAIQAIDPSSPIIAHLNAASCSALLGSYICLSLDRTPLHRWDAWFFVLALVFGSGAVALAYFLTPADDRSLSIVEGDLAATALFLCVFVWWIRPSCWKARPGPTFLFAMAPTILLILSIPGIVDSSTNFFLNQVMFLFIILGIMRIYQCEAVTTTATFASIM
jgi:hypothetical protein